MISYGLMYSVFLILQKMLVHFVINMSILSCGLVKIIYFITIPRPGEAIAPSLLATPMVRDIMKYSESYSQENIITRPYSSLMFEILSHLMYYVVILEMKQIFKKIQRVVDFFKPSYSQLFSIVLSEYLLQLFFLAFFKLLSVKNVQCA